MEEKYITQKDAEEIVARMGTEFLSQANTTYGLNNEDYVQSLLSINNTTYTDTPVKEDINFSIVGSPETGGYYQFYFMIFEKNRMAPLVVVRLERRRATINKSVDNSTLNETPADNITNEVNEKNVKKTNYIKPKKKDR